MEYGCIKKHIILLLICVISLVSCQSSSKAISINNDMKHYIKASKLDKCNIIQLPNYHLYDSLAAVIDQSCYDINKEQVTDYSVNIVENYRYLAYMYGCSLEEYYTNNMGLTEDEFYEKCYEEGEYDTKCMYTIGAIAYAEDIKVSDDEYSNYLEQSGYKQTELDSITKESIIYHLLNEKIKNLFTEEKTNESKTD